MAPRRCAGCPAIIPKGSFCDRCRRKEWKVRNDDRQIRRAVVAHSPVCVKCGATTDLTADHVVPLAKGGTNEGPRQTLCRSCNSRKGNRAELPETRGPSTTTQQSPRDRRRAAG